MRYVRAEELAQVFHETYERLAPDHGYETRQESARPWADVPENNKNLMIDVAREVLCLMWGANFVHAQEEFEREYATYMEEQAKLCACGCPLSDHQFVAAPPPRCDSVIVCSTPGCSRLCGLNPRAIARQG
jgi:hypothetical protein